MSNFKMKAKPPLTPNYDPANTPHFGPDDVAAIDYKDGSFRLVCCDCGLAHLLSFEVEVGGDRILMSAQRDEVATAMEREYLEEKQK